MNGVQLVPTQRFLAATPQEGDKLKPRLRITKKRTARPLDVRVKGLTRGKLRFKIVAKRIDGRTRVVAKIRQSRR